jgi:Acetyltransferase (GNAT) domain
MSTAKSSAKPVTKPDAKSNAKRISKRAVVKAFLTAPGKQIMAAQAALGTLKARHTARRNPTGFEFVFADRIDFINHADWDALAGHSVFLSRAYLRVLEAHPPTNLTPRYAIAYADGKPAVVMLLQRINVTGDRIRKKSNEQRLRDKPLDKYGEHLLVCGNVLIWGHCGFAFASDVEAKAAWLAVGEAIYRLRRADKLLGESDLVMVKDFPAADVVGQESLRLLGYRSVETEPDMVLTIRPEWKKPDDYLASLTSSYRSNAKKLQKDCATAGVTFRQISAAEMSARADELHGLYLQVHEGQGLRLATLNPAYLPALSEMLGNRFRCRVAEIEGVAVGFVTSLLDNETAVGYYIGYDKATNATAPIYLTLLGSCVDDAIEMGAKRMSIGRTALEPKAKMGCQPVALVCAVKHRLSALNPLLSAITRNVAHDDPPERSPFKTEKQPAKTNN